MRIRSVSTVLTLMGSSLIIASGVTLALFSAQTPTSVQEVTTGTIALDQSQASTVELANLMPGQSTTQNFSVRYSGTADAWIGVIPRVFGDLNDCDGGKLLLTLSNAGNPTILYQWNQPQPQVVRTGGDSLSPVASPFAQGAVVNLSLNYSLPQDTGNDCQSKSATVELQFTAVQTLGNTNSTNNGPLAWNAGVSPVTAGVDQEFVPSSQSDTAWLGNTFAQTFIAGRTGLLDRVSLELTRVPGTSSGPITVQLREIDGVTWPEERWSVRFKKNWNSYNGGEIAGFSPAEATNLVENLKVADFYYWPLSEPHAPISTETSLRPPMGFLLAQATVVGTELPEVHGRFTDFAFSTPPALTEGRTYALVVVGGSSTQYTKWLGSLGDPYVSGFAVSSGVYTQQWYVHDRGYDLHFRTYLR